MPEIIVSLKISKTQAGAIVSSFYLAYTIFSPLLGFLVDRVSARKLLILFCFIQGTGAFLMGKSASLFQACLFLAIVGMGSSAMWTPVFTLVQRWFGVRRRGMALGRKKCLILIHTSLSVSIILIISAGNHWNALLANVCIFGFFYAAAWPMYAAAAADFFPPEATGSVLGFWTIFYGLGFMLAGILGGYIADLTGTFTRSFLTAAITGGLAAFFFSQLKNTGHIHGQDVNACVA